jgi:hypothetical protein
MSSTTTSINLLHLNVNGIDSGKLSSFYSLMAPGNTIGLLSEHWFANHPTLLSHPSFFATSPRVPKVGTIGRDTSGLAIMVSQDIRHLCTLVYSKPYCMVLKVLGYHIGFIYLPPSLNDATVLDILGGIPGQLSMLIGDINVRFGAMTRDSTTLRTTRGNIISDYGTPQGLVQRVCNDGCSRNDHVYTRDPINWTYEWNIQDSINTDHGMIRLRLPTVQVPVIGIANNKRFGYSALKTPLVRDLIVSTWILFMHQP